MAGNGKLQTALLALGSLLMVASLILMVMIYSSLPGKPSEKASADAKRLAGELADNNLPEASIEEYKSILSAGGLDDKEQGAINYLIGKTYFEKIGDYEKAAAYYIRARALDPEGSYSDELGKNLIASLERMGRRLDAKRELDRQTNINPDTSRTAGKVIAKIGDRKITVTDFNEELRQLPQDMQDKINSPEEKRKFLDQVIGRDLIYHAALREGFDKETAVRKDLHRLEKEYLIQYYSQQKIAPTVRPDTADLRLYFNANKDKYGKKTFDAAREDVTRDYMNYIGSRAIMEYMKKLMQAEQVQVFEENLK
jgi:tetratricopeptide (TPR) repeat protein